MKIILKINLLLLAILVINSCSILGVVQSHKKVEGDYVVELKPIDKDPVYNMSINVIQGIAAFEDGYFTSQTSKGKFLLVNYLDKDGMSLFHKRLMIDSHGQDLSLEVVSSDLLYLYTTEGHYNEDNVSNMVRISVELPKSIDGKRDMSQLVVKLDKTFPLHFTNCTPTLSEDKMHFAIRSGNKIIIATRDQVENGNMNEATSFEIEPSKLVDDNGNALWFQGIAMKDNLIYCMVGNNSIGSIKLLYKFDLTGQLLETISLDKDEFAKQLKHKLEPEGITFKDGVLHYTIMLKGGTGGNRKFLFKL